MPEIKYLLDTNIIIGMHQHSQPVITLFEVRQAFINQCAYSAITRMEVLGFPGITEQEKLVINSLLKQMNHIGINEAVEDATIDLKQQHRIKLPDAIILATAKVNSLELLTLDKKLAGKE